jgi:hypothetical protein
MILHENDVYMLTTESERNLLGCLFAEVSEAQRWW